MTRRIASLMIDPHLLLYMTSGKFEVVGITLPSDVTLRYTYVDTESLTINVVFESESFEEIPLGGIIPRLCGPIIRRIE